MNSSTLCLNNFEGDDSTISVSLHKSLIEVFMEDKHIIEAQQRALDEDPDFQAADRDRRRAAGAFPAHARSADRQGRG
jgi:hypothetical protein